MRLSLITFLLLFSIAALHAQSGSEGMRKGPNFKLEDLDGNLVELNTQTGEGPILLSFWATWCKH